MRVLVFDTESDGFVDEATRVWCIAAQDKDDKVMGKLFTPDMVQVGLAYLHSADVLVCHNFKKHDGPLLKKLYGWEPKSHQVVVDTLIYSRMLYPKRPNPEGYTGKAPHSLEAWGLRLGFSKQEHEDWSKYTDEMGTRCLTDVKINQLLLEELEREAGNLSNYYELLRPSKCA